MQYGNIRPFSGAEARFFSSESVSEGHPDKIADQISDALLDLYIGKDTEARTAIEVMCSVNRVILAGETRSKAPVSAREIEATLRGVVRRIGYMQENFHWEKLAIDNYMHAQSADIAAGVDAVGDKPLGAGDQGVMFGYAVDETPEKMPAALSVAHRLMYRMAQARKRGERPEFYPDAKCQFTLAYEKDKPVRAHCIVVSTQHPPDVSIRQLRDLVRPYVLGVLPDPSWMCDDAMFYVNPAGPFITGGPDGDCGLTGRKIVVDTYGGAAPHGGGAFSGKDPTKVDRSACYAARYLAKNIVAAGLCRKCLIQLAYGIGISHPLAIYVDQYGTGVMPDSALVALVSKVMDLSPAGIRAHLGLQRPIYEHSAAHGHFGRTPQEDGSFSWEKTDLIEALRKAA